MFSRDLRFKFHWEENHMILRLLSLEIIVALPSDDRTFQGNLKHFNVRAS